MSLTKIGSIGINTGIQLAGVTTVTTLHVGSGVTLSSDGDVFATGISTFSEDIKVGSGVTISPDGDGFYTGVVTATSFSGSGANLTGIDTDLVSDTSPQLGGNLDVNTKNIVFGDSGGATDDRLTFGAGTDLSIYHDGSASYIEDGGAGSLIIKSSQIILRESDDTNMAYFKNGGAVELNYDNTKRFETTSSGVSVTGGLTASDTSTFNADVLFAGASSKTITFDQSEGHIRYLDNAQAQFGTQGDLRIYHTGSNSYIDEGSGTGALIFKSNIYSFRNAADNEQIATFNENGAVELYYDNVKSLETTTEGIEIKKTASGQTARLKIESSNGGQAGIELRTSLSGTNRASRIDMYNQDTLQWSIFNDYQQNGDNDFSIRHGAEESIVCYPDSRVELYNDDSKKFETTADGVRVTQDGSNNLDLHTNRFIVNRDEGFYFDQNNTGNSFIFRVSNSSALDTNALQLYAQGHAYFLSRSTANASMTIRKGVSGADSIDYIQCRANSNAAKFIVNGDGTVRSATNTYTSTSDVKMKENVVDANSQWNDIKAVKVRNFNYKESTGLPTLKQIGVVAQELETTSPNLVEESIDRDPDTGEDLGTTTKNVKYSILYMKSIKALQEAQTRIETLEAKVAALEG